MQGIGLLGLLIVVALVFYLMFAAGGKGSAGTALQVQKEVRPQVEQMSGKDADGKPATDSLTIDTAPKGVVVNSVVAGGAFDTKFGVKTGDVITDIGPLAKDQFQDVGTAKAYLSDAYARDWNITVLRDGQRLTLPQTPQAAAPQAGSPTAQPPAQRTTPRSQLEGILKGRGDNNDVPTH